MYCMVLCGILGIILLFTSDFSFGTVFAIAIGVLGTILLIGDIQQKRDDKEHRAYIKRKYEQDLEKYPFWVEEYKKENTKAEEEYKEALVKYHYELNEYENDSNKTRTAHNKLLSSLEKSLSDLYDKNIIYSKYRNMVAIVAIDEYLTSGRCYALEGSDGAYNLYENELRQNIIIDKLSYIIDNLEQIQRNQFSLYQELLKTNNDINDIIFELKEIKSNTKLISYFTEVTALAETSPKIYHGITF